MRSLHYLNGERFLHFQLNRNKMAACSAELKRIGENFKALGADMIDPPETLVIDQVSFDRMLLSPKVAGSTLGTGRQASRQAGRA
jgi:hypothetical protein